jgi:hypothetical protein
MADTMDTEAPADLAYTKQFWNAAGTVIRDTEAMDDDDIWRESRLCTDPDGATTGILNFSGAAEAILCVWAITASADRGSLLVLKWNDANANNWNDNDPVDFGYGAVPGWATGLGTRIIWRKGFRRFFMISEDKKHLWAYPAPEMGAGSNTLNKRPMPWWVWGSVGDIPNIITVAPDLGANDSGFPIVDEGGAGETNFTKYPIYHKLNDESRVVLCANAGGVTGKDIDGDSTWVNDGDGNTYNPDTGAVRARLNPYTRNIVLDNEIPDDLPVDPIFIYTNDNKLQIWYYSADNNALRGYDWQFNLLYEYVFDGIEFANFALGRDKDGMLIACITTTDTIIFARHQSSDTLYYPNVSETDLKTNAGKILSDLARIGFQTWYIDRENASTDMFVKPRFSGTDRGEHYLIPRSEMSKQISRGDAKPNRQLIRSVWQEYYDRIIVKNGSGDMGIAGLPESIYALEYSVSDKMFNVDLGNTLAYLLYGLYSKRREYLKTPHRAYRLQMYDTVKVFDREFKVLANKSDYGVSLKSDLELVNLGNVYGAIELWDCLINQLAVSINLSWASIESLDLACAPCAGCQPQWDDLTTLILEIVTANYTPETSFSVRNDADAHSAIRYILLNNLDETNDAGETLQELFDAYRECLGESCGIDYE